MILLAKELFWIDKTMICRVKPLIWVEIMATKNKELNL